MNTNNDNDIVLFGETNFRNGKVRFGIKMDDRRRHMYVIGKSGMGKSELLKTVAIQDIQSGRGLAVIDPHGDLAEDLLNYIPRERIKDVIYINPADLDYPIAFNILESVDYDKRHLVADGVMAVFKKIFGEDVWSARMEYILNYTILALLETPESTLLGINRMLAEKEFRKSVVDNVKDPEVKAFWTKEFAGYTERYTAEAVPAIQNKIGQFVANALIRNMIGQPKSSFDVRKAMDENKILLVNISKGKVGEDASKLFGGLLITKIQLAAMSRVDIPMYERRDFVLIVDEFQNFATESFATILSEARKFKLSLVIAHQYVAQMDEKVADAVFGNVGTIVTFRVGAEDGELLEKELAPEFMATDLVNLGKRQIYLKLMIDGITSRAFSAVTMDTPQAPEENLRNDVIQTSREQWAHNRKEVEEAIAAWRLPAEIKTEDNRVFEPQRAKDYSKGGQLYDRPPVARHSQTSPSGGHSQPVGNEPRVPLPPKPRKQGVSLGDALKQGPVDFRGRKIIEKVQAKTTSFENEPQVPREKPKVDLEGLRKAIAQSLAESKKGDTEENKQQNQPEEKEDQQ